MLLNRDMAYEVTASQGVLDEWRVEAINYGCEGECYVAIFSGPQAKERAEEYATLKRAGIGVAL